MLTPEIINNSIWSRLTKIQKQNRVSGAYLFIGPRGLGKFDLALEFIYLDDKLNKQRKSIEARIHPDVILVEPEIEEKKGKIKEKQISIDQIKEALKMFSYFPQESDKKVLIIKSIDRLTLTAANSLLKTVEELAGNYLVIMTASSEGKVLSTIRSRCQKIYFNLKNNEEIRDFVKVKNNELENEKLTEIVFLSKGRIKEAEKLLNDKSSQEDRLEKLSKFKKALRGDLKIGFEIAQNDTKNKIIFSEYLNDWIYYLSNFLKENITEDRDIRVQKKIFQIYSELNQVQNCLNDNPNANIRLLLENFFVQIK